MIKPSLRDMKKEATAHALAEAAFELALARGLHGFVVEDVVQLAGYSRRTFANHYSCKEEAIAMVAVPFHGVDEGTELLETMPDNIAPLDAMREFMKLQLTADYLRKMRELALLAKEYPTLEPYILNVHYKLQAMAQEVLNHLFNDRYPVWHACLIAGALTGAIMPLCNGSLNVLLPGQSSEEVPGALSFEEYMDNVFEYLRKGF
jgi:AcrR family transcriptional regulator